ncbi:MAG: DUF1015 domain-containing protein, partial [Oscillospiraceae bacterium]|nr:DUF1015 domain-containing protein [Oscillospiraceae bacterium]
MAVFKPFRAIRPVPEHAAEVAALPYDVMNSDEAREMVKGNPYSFLHVDKAEIDLPKDIGLYDDAVYAKAKENMEKLISDGICVQDSEACFYIYRQTMNGRSQTGLVGCASIDDYMHNIIKKHELTRADKEADRIRHVDTCDANTGPIFLCYRENDRIASLIEAWKAEHTPVYDFVSGNVGNTVWVVDDAAVCEKITALFADVRSFYIADGHHRCASAVKVGQKRRAEKPDYTGEEEFNFFLAVLFPQNELEIMDYNRVMKDLGGHTAEEFMALVSEKFTVEKAPVSPYKPELKHTFGMLLQDQWYVLTAKDGTFDASNPVAQLDVSILQKNLIAPILGIEDPR